MTRIPTEPALRFHALGAPATQGSKKAFQRGGRVVMIEQTGKKLGPWRAAVEKAARAAAGPDWQPLTGPVSVRLLIAMPRPQSAPKRRRVWPSGRVGDADKLARSCLDAIGDAGIYGDDGQVCELYVVKDYPGPHIGQTTPGVIVVVSRILDHEPTPARGVPVVEP